MRRLSLNRSEPAKKSGQDIPKNRCRTTIAERMVEALAELPFIGDQVGLLKPRPGGPQRDTYLPSRIRKKPAGGTAPAGFFLSRQPNKPISRDPPPSRSRGWRPPKAARRHQGG